MDKIGVLALLLAIPLAVLANLLTPTVKNWIALLSKKMTAQRIKVLESELNRLESPGSIESVLGILRYLFIVLTCLSLGMLVLTISTLLLFTIYHRYVIQAAYALFVIAAYFSLTGIQEIGKNKDSTYRDKLLKQIVFLKSKL